MADQHREEAGEGGRSEDRFELAAESVADLERGELPRAARHRLAEETAGGPWTSDLSVSELVAVEGVGFRPLGLVLGSAIYHLGAQWGPGYATQGGFWRTYPCPHGYGGGGFGGGGFGGGGLGGAGFGRGGFGGFGGITHEGARPGYTWEHRLHERGLTEAKDLALGRLEAEAVALGAHGVAGVRLRFGRFDAGRSNIEVTAVGTAIHRPGRPPGPRPFTSHLSGQELGKLLRGGWVPAGLVMGVGVIEVDPGCEVEWQLRSWSNSSLRQYTEASHICRELAVASLEVETARLGEGAVGVEAVLRSHEVGESKLIELVITGTAVRRFSREPLPEPPLVMLPLRDRPAVAQGGRS